MFVRAVIVDDDVQIQSGRCFAINSLQKSDEFLMTWRGKQSPITLPSRMFKAAKQRRCAVSPVVVRKGTAPSRFHRESRLSSRLSLNEGGGGD